MPRAAIFLDRDGVINRSTIQNGKPYPPQSVAELAILPGVKEACSRLRQAGFLLVVVTNQPDVARKKQSQQVVEAIHRVLQETLHFDAIYVCYHDDVDQCACRKPKPGMLLQAAQELAIDLNASFMVGDRWRDILAGQQAGCTTCLIDYNYAEEMPVKPDISVHSLLEASQWILSQLKERSER